MAAMPILMKILTILVVFAADGSCTGRRADLCFSKYRRDRFECDAHEPHLCCSGIPYGSCCRSPEPNWCNCMDAKLMSYTSPSTFDSVTFYQKPDGTSPVDDLIYNAEFDGHTQACMRPSHALKDCNARVFLSGPGEDGPLRGWANRRSRIDGADGTMIPKNRTGSFKRLEPEIECWYPDMAWYALPSGEMESIRVPPKKVDEVMALLDAKDFVELRRLERDHLRGLV